MVKNMNFTKGKYWSRKLGMLLVMCALVASMVYIGYLGETLCNWKIGTSTTKIVVLCLISFIGCSYVVIKDKILAMGMIGVQTLTLSILTMRLLLC